MDTETKSIKSELLCSPQVQPGCPILLYYKSLILTWRLKALQVGRIPKLFECIYLKISPLWYLYTKSTLWVRDQRGGFHFSVGSPLSCPTTPILEEFLFSQIVIEAGKETICVPITWEQSFLESNTILGTLSFISDFLGPRESIRIQESKHAPSEMESKFLAVGGGGGGGVYILPRNHLRNRSPF